MDDGTVARLAADRYVVSTTTANAGGVMSHMEFASQVLWPELDVRLSSVTEQWAQYAVAGPNARDVAGGGHRPGASTSRTRPFPSWRPREITIARRHAGAAVPHLLLGRTRLRARRSGALRRRPSPRALMAAGEPFGIRPYGLEALNVLRIEKGHAAGGELNGQTTAPTSGSARMVSTKKDFIGAAHGAAPGPDRRTSGRCWSASGRSSDRTGRRGRAFPPPGCGDQGCGATKVT